MGLKWCQIFGWEIIAKVRRWATCAANSSLKLMEKIPTAGMQCSRSARIKRNKIADIVADHPLNEIYSLSCVLA